MKKIASTYDSSKSDDAGGDGDPSAESGPGQIHYVDDRTAAADDASNIDSAVTTATPGGASKFDPSRLRLSTNFATLAGVKKQILLVPIRKPVKSEWVQFHPDERWRIEVATLIWKEERETHYVVDPELWPMLAADIVPTLLITTVSTQGVVFLTPIRLPGADGRHNEWHRSLLEAAHLGMKGGWIRIAANMSLGGYDVYSAAGDLGAASWPATPFDAVLEIALRDRLIDKSDHPILRRLRGES
jgi:hypothetical protein